MRREHPSWLTHKDDCRSGCRHFDKEQRRQLSGCHVQPHLPRCSIEIFRPRRRSHSLTSGSACMWTSWTTLGATRSISITRNGYAGGSGSRGGSVGVRVGALLLMSTYGVAMAFTLAGNTKKTYTTRRLMPSGWLVGATIAEITHQRPPDVSRLHTRPKLAARDQVRRSGIIYDPSSILRRALVLLIPHVLRASPTCSTTTSPKNSPTNLVRHEASIHPILSATYMISTAASEQSNASSFLQREPRVMIFHHTECKDRTVISELDNDQQGYEQARSSYLTDSANLKLHTKVFGREVRSSVLPDAGHRGRVRLFIHYYWRNPGTCKCVRGSSSHITRPRPQGLPPRHPSQGTIP